MPTAVEYAVISAPIPVSKDKIANQNPQQIVNQNPQNVSSHDEKEDIVEVSQTSDQLSTKAHDTSSKLYESTGDVTDQTYTSGHVGVDTRA